MWTWPQYLVAAWLVFALTSDVRLMARDRTMESGAVTFAILLCVLIRGGLAYALHCGGFW